MVDIIIPVYISVPQQLEMTKKCIESIEKNTAQPYQLYIVDNGSYDEAKQYLKTVNAIVITHAQNEGFSRACNKALKMSTAQYKILLNNDTEIPAGWVESMIDVFAKDNKIGIVGPLSTAITQSQYSENYKDVGSDYIEVPMVAFFCAVIKRDVINQIGYLDERFGFGKCEDDDYCIRVKHGGWKIVLDPKTIVLHHHNQTFKTIPNFSKIHDENYAFLLEKWQMNQPHKSSTTTTPVIMPNPQMPNVSSKHTDVIPEKAPKKVYVAILNQGSIRPELTNTLIRISHDIHDIKIVYPNSMPIAHNRNDIVQRFLKTDCDYLLMIDSDIVPKKNPLLLLAYNKDIIGGVCPQYNNGTIYCVVMEKTPKGLQEIALADRNGIKEVDAIGTGCILIARRVLEKVKAPFMRKWDNDGLQDLGLDFYFCEKAKKHGFSVWADWESVCSHYKTIDLLSISSLQNTIHMV